MLNSVKRGKSASKKEKNFDSKELNNYQKTSMTTKQEIQLLLKKRVPGIVMEHIVKEVLDSVGDWMGELIGKLETMPADCSQKQLDEAANTIHDALLKETIKQLEKLSK
jgi:predicted ArsR family transcriptional regulator